MSLGNMDPALVCSGPMSNISYDSHVVTRRRMADELPRIKQNDQPDSYTAHQMELEVQRVSRELFKAFNGMNAGFEEAKDQIVIDELSTHTDVGRQELIHPYKTIYGRDLNSVLRDNLGDSWEEACTTLMCEMRMYELECLRRRMEDEAVSAAARHAAELADTNSLLSSIKSSVKSPTHSAKSSGSKKSNKKNGAAGRNMKLEEMIDEAAKVEDKFTGHSCLLITWKTNPEVEQFKELYMDKEIKTHKRKNKTPVDPGDLVSEKSLQKHYKIIGKGEGVERLLIKGKKPEQVEEVDGDDFRYYLLAGTTHPYPDDTFYSVGRVPRKLLMKYLGVKMYLVRLKEPPPKVADRKTCANIATLMLSSAGVCSPKHLRQAQT